MARRATASPGVLWRGRNGAARRDTFRRVAARQEWHGPARYGKAGQAAPWPALRFARFFLSGACPIKRALHFIGGVTGAIGGSSLYRLALPARNLCASLEARGLTTVFENALPERASRTGPSDYAVIAMLRTTGPGLVQWCGMERARGATLVYNLDDDLWSIPEWNPAYRRDGAADVTWAMANCDLVWVTTEALARKVATELNMPTRVLPNLIDLDQWPKTEPTVPQDRPVRVGWAGSDTHKNDIAIAVPAIKEAVKRFGSGVEFVFLGDWHTDLLRDVWGRNFLIEPSVRLEHYPQKLAGLGCDLFLAPLEENEFNKSKSNIRFLESTLAGGAVVASAWDGSPYNDFPPACQYPVGHVGDWTERLCAAVADCRQGGHVAVWQKAAAHVIAFWSWQAPAARLWEAAYLEAAGVK